MLSIPFTALPSLIDWPRDEAAHRGLPWEIWWFTAALDANGRRLAAHVLAIHLGDGSLRVSATLTDLDRDRELTRTTHAAPGTCALPTDRLAIRTALYSFEGSFADGYRLGADLGDGNGFELTLTPTRPVLHNGGAGQFRFQGVTTTQYSIGALQASGQVRLDGASLAVSGDAWHDRQWDHWVRQGEPASFTWFGLCLEGGDTLSVFDTGTPRDPGHRWATVALADGTHIVAAADPVPKDVRAAGSGRQVPQRWTLAIPHRDARLVLTQRRIADQPAIYTGLLEVDGTYAGRPTRGYGFCDLVGPIGPAAGVAQENF